MKLLTALLPLGFAPDVEPRNCLNGCPSDGFLGKDTANPIKPLSVALCSSDIKILNLIHVFS